MGGSNVVGSAWSIDGTTFSYRSPLGGGVQLGGYVVVESPQGPLLGQVLSQRSLQEAGRRFVTGDGRLLDAPPGRLAFDQVDIAVAPDQLLAERLARRAATLELGTLRDAPEVVARLEAKGFNRHTFMCGQSGSGKTYSLGRLLEELVLRTRLPLLVLDPNGDHVHLGRTRAGADQAVAAAYAEAAGDVRVLGAEPRDAVAPLRIRFRELGATAAAALLQLDPIADRAEYNALLHALRSAPAEGVESMDAAIELFRHSGDEVLGLIKMRVENLGVDRMAAWAKPSGSTIAEVWARDEPRALVADTSGFEERRERIAVTVAVLEHLWAHRKHRRPLLLVVDEAHDVCPADPADPLERLAVDRFTRIAGEGRKYGIHLLLASQRPDKLPENVLSQCDNLLLMRVNSAGDRAALASMFGFVPPELIELAGTFGLGESLLAGKVSPDPQLARTGVRLTPEGGADVPTDWAIVGER
ncbi:MAG: ATP-binding protein [Nitriliruptor sp.]|nr:MAG: ATP-binding protein [Nitriliruptor sp.]